MAEPMTEEHCHICGTDGLCSLCGYCYDHDNRCRHGIANLHAEIRRLQAEVAAEHARRQGLDSALQRWMSLIAQALGLKVGVTADECAQALAALRAPLSEEQIKVIASEFFPGWTGLDETHRELCAKAITEALATAGRTDAATLSGDDDSVNHAWDTVPVSVTVDVDRGIAPLVEAFNRVPGVRTFASCEGHPHSDIEKRGYVMLYIEPEGITSLAAAIDAALAQEEP